MNHLSTLASRCARLIACCLIVGAISIRQVPSSALQAADGQGGLAASLQEAEQQLAQAREQWHAGPVVAAVLSADGRLALTGGADRTLRLTEVKSSKTIHRLEGHEGTVFVVALSADGKRAVSAGSDRTVRVWDLEKGAPLHCFRGLAEPAGCVACSADGSRVAAGGPDGQVRLWDVAAGKPLHVLAQKAPVLCVAFVPGGKQLVSGGHDGSLCTWDVQTGKQLRRQTDHADGVLVLAFDTTGERLLSVGGAVKFDKQQRQFNSGDNAVRVWDATNGKLLKTIAVEGLLPMAAVCTSDGRQVHLAGFRLLTEKREMPLMLKAFLGTVTYGVGFFLDRGKETTSRAAETISCDLDTGKASPPASLGGVPMAFSADGRSGLSVWPFDRRMDVWDPATRKPQHWIWLKKMETPTRERDGSTALCLAMSADGQRVLGGGTDRTLYLWDADSGRPMLKVGTHQNPLSSVALSPDGRRALSACGWTNDDKTNPTFAFLMEFNTDVSRPRSPLQPDAQPDHRLRLWDVEQCKELTALEGHRGRINAVTFSPDGLRAASASSDQTVCIWDVANTKLLHRGQAHKGRVNAVAFSPDGKRIVSGGDDRLVRVWDAGTGKEMNRFSGHTDPIWAVAWSPDGKTIASAGGMLGPKTDPRIILWNAATGKKLHELSGHTTPVVRLGFSADGTRLYSAARVEIKVWGSATGKELRSLPQAKGITAAFAAERPSAVAASWGFSHGTTTCWDLEAGLYLGTLTAP